MIKTFKTEYDLDNHSIEGDIDSMIDYLNSIKTRIMKQHPNATKIKVSIDAEEQYVRYGGPVMYRALVVNVTRPETPEEVCERESKERTDLENQEKEERETYVRLKEKLGE